MPVAFLLQQLKRHPVIQAIHEISRQKQLPIYLVGGAVRDVLSQVLPEKDFDFVMERDLTEVARLFARKISGSLFQLSEEPPNYRVVFSRQSHRIEVDFSEFRGATLSEDLAHRDFTVNAIALCVDELCRTDTPEFCDPLGGADDLRTQVLRLASPRAFDQDPLRVLRAVRIAAARNLSIEARTKEEIRRHRDQLSQVATERIRSEFFKTMSLPGAAEHVKLLDELELLSLLIPQADRIKPSSEPTPEAGPNEDRLVQALRWGEWCVEHVGKLFPRFEEGLRAHLTEEIESDVLRHSLLKTALLLHECKDASPPDENLVAALTERLRLGRRAGRILGKLMESPPQVFRLMAMPEVGARPCYRFFRDLGPEGVDGLIFSWALFMASSLQNVGGEAEMRIRSLMSRVIAYYFEDYVASTPMPLLSGKDLMHCFGLREGKTIGWLLTQLARAESEGLVSTRNEALQEAARLLTNSHCTGLRSSPETEIGKGC